MLAMQTIVIIMTFSQVIIILIICRLGVSLVVLEGEVVKSS